MPDEKTTALAFPSEKSTPTFIEVRRKKPETQIQKSHSPIKTSTKSISIAGKSFDVDPQQLIRMIKHITQTIGEYRHESDNNPLALVMMYAARKARSDLVSKLESGWHIHWKIDEETGASEFYL